MNRNVTSHDPRTTDSHTDPTKTVTWTTTCTCGWYTPPHTTSTAAYYAYTRHHLGLACIRDVRTTEEPFTTRLATTLTDLRTNR